MNNHNTKNCRAHLKCTYCNGKGHTYDYCWRRKNATEGGQTRSKANHIAPQNNSKEALPNFPFSREECHQLLSQLLTKMKSASANLVIFGLHTVVKKQHGYWIVVQVIILFVTQICLPL
jgi:hypothetical protein